MSKSKQISTTSLAKKYNIKTKDMFAHLLQKGLIEKKGDIWALTNRGLELGGIFVTHEKYGKYITWPYTLELDIPNEKIITATAIGKHFNLSANKINFILSELGWAQKALKGWKITLQGEKHGGLQAEDRKSGIPYIRWPESIVDSKVLKNTIQDIQGLSVTEEESKNKANHQNDFREKFEAKFRATDGHFVRSKAEILIDNWLYMAEIVHAYERKLPVEEDVYSDFYIPTGKVYIEFWGYENNEKYLARKKVKQDIYEKYGFNLIELTEKDVSNLDDVLPRLLLKYDVQAY